MRVLVVGGDGQVGHELVGFLAPFAQVVATRRGDLDMSDLEAIRTRVRSVAPNVIVNAAAYTDVDGAEREPNAAMRINRDAVAVLGEEARRLRLGLIHYSTDFVFDGERTSGEYAESDAVAPCNAYGVSKLAGERALEEMNAPAIVLRTAWVYSVRRKSFVSTILRLARERPVLRVVADQVGNPTFCRDLAHATALLLHGMRHDVSSAIEEARGIYHLAGSGVTSRHALACAVVEADPRRSEHVVTSIEPIATHEMPLPARRPLRTPLDGTKARERFGLALPPWRESLDRALADR